MIVLKVHYDLDHQLTLNLRIMTSVLANANVSSIIVVLHIGNGLCVHFKLLIYILIVQGILLTITVYSQFTLFLLVIKAVIYYVLYN